MTKTSDAVQILKRKFGNNIENREKIEEASVNLQVAELIYESRTSAGLTQKQLADLIGTKQPVIARLEDADYEGHSLRMLQKIADALNRKICISFLEPEVVSETEQVFSVNSLGGLLLRKVDEWVEAGWKTFQELGIFVQLPQLQYATARFLDELEAEPDLLEAEILTAEKLANSDPNNPLASVRMAKEFYDLGRPLVFAVSVSQVNDSEPVNVLLQLQSLNNEKLPPDVCMILLDEQGNHEYFIDAPDEIIGSQSDGTTKVIYLPFKYSRGEIFGVEISRGDLKIHEKFLV